VEEEVLGRSLVVETLVLEKVVICSLNHYHHPQTHTHHHYLRTPSPRMQAIKEAICQHLNHLQEVMVHLHHLVHH
jgi:hypothetical protein